MLAWFLLFVFLRLRATNRANRLASECFRKAVLACLLLFLLLRLREGNRANRLASERLRKAGKRRLKRLQEAKTLRRYAYASKWVLLCLAIKRYGFNFSTEASLYIYLLHEGSDRLRGVKRGAESGGKALRQGCTAESGGERT